MPTRIPEDQITEHFWTKVDQNGPVPSHRPGLGRCWVWTSYCKPNGYGAFSVHRRPWYAHRFSYGLANGPYDLTLKVLHHCDNPPCVRPGHLFLGTLKQNTEDAVSKGRMHPGEANGAAKLTNDQVIAIRLLVPDFQSMSYSKRGLLARALGIHPHHLTDIIAHRKWRTL